MRDLSISSGHGLRTGAGPALLPEGVQDRGEDEADAENCGEGALNDKKGIFLNLIRRWKRQEPKNKYFPKPYTRAYINIIREAFLAFRFGARYIENKMHKRTFRNSFRIPVFTQCICLLHISSLPAHPSLDLPPERVPETLPPRVDADGEAEDDGVDEGYPDAGVDAVAGGVANEIARLGKI